MRNAAAENCVLAAVLEAIEREHGTNQYGGNLDDPFNDSRPSRVPELEDGPSGPAPGFLPPTPPGRGTNVPGHAFIVPGHASNPSTRTHSGIFIPGALAPISHGSQPSASAHPSVSAAPLAASSSHPASRPSTVAGNSTGSSVVAAASSRRGRASKKAGGSSTSGRALSQYSAPREYGVAHGLDRPNELYWQETNGGMVIRRTPGPFFYEATSPTALKRQDDERREKRRERARERAESREKRKAEKEVRKAQAAQAAQQSGGGSGRLRSTASFSGSLRRAFQALKKTSSSSKLKPAEEEEGEEEDGEKEDETRGGGRRG